MGWFKENVAANHIMELFSNDGNVHSYFGQQEISNYYGTTMEVYLGTIMVSSLATFGWKTNAPACRFFRNTRLSEESRDRSREKLFISLIVCMRYTSIIYILCAYVYILNIYDIYMLLYIF